MKKIQVSYVNTLLLLFFIICEDIIKLSWFKSQMN